METIPDCPNCSNNSVVCISDFRATLNKWESFSRPFEIWQCNKCKTKYKIHFKVDTVDIIKE
jgi:hypothetical protein